MGPGLGKVIDSGQFDSCVAVGFKGVDEDEDGLPLEGFSVTGLRVFLFSFLGQGGASSRVRKNS